MARRISPKIKISLCALLCLLLAACEVELYRSVPEREANLMIAMLDHYGINATKQESEPIGSYSLFVQEDQFSYAVELLAAQGYPRKNRTNLAELFKPSGLVPTRFEEQVRFIYGLSEELSHTISLFDGVIDTRVHIALSENPEANDIQHVAAYIKYDQHIDFDSFIPQVKKLISDSIGKVDYQNVEVLAIPTYLRKHESGVIKAYKFPAGIRVLPQYYDWFIALNLAILLVILQSSGLALWFYLQWKKATAKIAAEQPQEAEIIDQTLQDESLQDESSQDPPSQNPSQQNQSPKAITDKSAQIPPQLPATTPKNENKNKEQKDNE